MGDDIKIKKWKVVLQQTKANHQKSFLFFFFKIQTHKGDRLRFAQMRDFGRVYQIQENPCDTLN